MNLSLSPSLFLPPSLPPSLVPLYPFLSGVDTQKEREVASGVDTCIEKKRRVSDREKASDTDREWGGGRERMSAARMGARARARASSCSAAARVRLCGFCESVCTRVWAGRRGRLRLAGTSCTCKRTRMGSARPAAGLLISARGAPGIRCLQHVWWDGGRAGDNFGLCAPPGPRMPRQPCPLHRRRGAAAVGVSVVPSPSASCRRVKALRVTPVTGKGRVPVPLRLINAGAGGPSESRVH